MSNDLFCAFQPKRATVPSLPLLFVSPEIVRPATTKLARPRMPSAFFAAALASPFARIAESGICSTSPRPKVGVGMRKIALTFFTAVAKSGCVREQAAAPVLPLIVKIACTPPSGVSSAFRTKRTSRTGPFSVRNDSTLSRPPFCVANATCGLTAGLVPPTAGCAWQPPQLSRFIRGPSPSATCSAPSKSALPALKYAVC
jgi:hypothetical protein